MVIPWGQIHAEKRAGESASTLYDLWCKVEESIQLLKDNLDSPDLDLICRLVIQILEEEGRRLGKDI